MGRTLVAGIGNIFLGDDGFGAVVANRVRQLPLPGDVDVADFGIRGVHLAYELADGRYDSVILVDAVPRGEPPGTLYVIEPDADDRAPSADVADAHSLTPDAVLAWLRRLGGYHGRIVIVGCEPASLEESIELSAPVTASIDDAVQLVLELIARTERSAEQCA